MKSEIIGILNPLLAIGVITTVLLTIFSTSPFRKSLKLICSCIVLLSLANAVTPLIYELENVIIDTNDPEIDVEIDISDELLNKESARYIAIYAKEMLVSKFSIPSEKLLVGVTLSENQDGSLLIKSITVELNGFYGDSGAEIAEFISDTFYCECILLTNEEEENVQENY